MHGRNGSATSFSEIMPKAMDTEVPLDEIYRQLKEQDEEWLETSLRERWSRTHEAGNGTAAQRTNGRDEHKGVAPPQLVSSARPMILINGRGRRSDYEKPWYNDMTASILPDDVKVSAHLRFLREFDWSATELGPMSKWGSPLRKFFNLMVTDPRPAALCWGEEQIMIYNEAYIPIAGKLHPHRIMGKPCLDAWYEAADTFRKCFEIGNRTGQATCGEAAPFIVSRNGYSEEMYASWSMIPVPAEDGKTGYYNSVAEVTKLVLSERRMSTLLWLGQCLALAKDSRDFWKQTQRGLLPNEADIPFAALYAADPHEYSVAQKAGGYDASHAPSETSSTFEAKEWILEGMIGLPAHCPCLPSHIDSVQAAEQLTPLFTKAMTTGEITMLDIGDGSFPPSLAQYAKARACGDLCTAALLLPIIPTLNKESVRGFVILGINPRREYDNDYRDFIQLVYRQMATSFASIILVEDEIRRNRIAAELAAQDRIRLSEQLAMTRQEAADNETRFRRMADQAPVAMFHFDEIGNAKYVNDSWYELTEHPRDAFYPLSWYNVIHEDDHPLMDVKWSELMNGESVLFELRLRKPFVTTDWVGGEKVEGTTWIIAAAYPEKREDGTVKAITGCLTDISRQKWTEEFQMRKTSAAMELKRQQENFMDMTSHEARNPLSAITLCAESIVTTLKELLTSKSDPLVMSRDTLESHLESAEIIMTCATHQRRIIDDVLTLSKLDSGMLLITPVEVQPTEIISQALKMFDSELQKADIDLQYHVEDSYRKLDVKWVNLDPSRLLQVLINFLTNAIKFTQPQAERRIQVILSAHAQKPSREEAHVDFVNDETPRSASLSPTCSRAEEPVYLCIRVKDSGRGLSKDEMKLLFQRFQQASPKTHVEYGGSGLGLFISRQLVKMQGGQIGVASGEGEGATFAFYIRASRCPAPRTKVQPRKELAAPKIALARTGSLLDVSVDIIQSPVDAEPDNSKDSPAGLVAIAEDVPVLSHILIVEDNLVNQAVMRKQLTRAGFKIAVANHGIEALEHIRSSRFCKGQEGHPLDIVLMDVEMPIMDGLTCVRAIRAMEQSSHLLSKCPVIAVTANARAEQQTAALEAGVNSIVTKPFKMGELIPELYRVKKMVDSDEAHR